jgi:chemotaxis methyl-accepting protein methylase
MTGQYSTKSFFRQMPNALLARYFKEKRDSRRLFRDLCTALVAQSAEASREIS